MSATAINQTVSSNGHAVSTPAPSTATSPRLKGLKCRECDATYELEAKHVCEFCFGPLEVEYDYDVIGQTISREKIQSGPHSIWRYADLLRRYHPDHNGGDRGHEKALQAVIEAYTQLKSRPAFA